MITHLAHLPTVYVRGVRRGMPVAECGFDVGCEVSVAWNPRYVDCKPCLEILFNSITRPLDLPHVPGPLPQRTPMRAATPDEIDHLDTPIEFRRERPRRRRTFVEWGVSLLAAFLLMVAAVVVGSLTHAPAPAPRRPVVTPAPYGPPAVQFTTMPARP